jgi:uncharacterized glyoxalase superfamily protein PhnB
MAANATACTFSPCLFYRDAPALIDWLERAFGFRKRLVVPGEGGSVAHAELSFGNGVVMVGSAKPERGWVSTRDLPALNQVISVTVDDPDAHYARAKGAGAEILQELKEEDYGSRGYMARDPEGNQWYFGTYRPGGHWTE